MIAAALSLAWLIGASWVVWDLPGGAPVAVLLSALPALLPRRGLTGTVLIVLLCITAALGAVWRWHGVSAPPARNDVSMLAGVGPVRLRGVVHADTEERARTSRTVVHVESRETPAGWQQATGGVLVRMRLGTKYRAGDEVEVTGSLSPPRDASEMEHRQFLARQGLGAVLDFPRIRIIGHRSPSWPRSWLMAGRSAAGRALDRALPQPEAALARGIVLGDRAAIPDTLTDDFNRSGTSHLIAISGFNITLVAALVVGPLVPVLGRRPASVVALCTIAVYALFVGVSPSVARALVMGVLVIGAGISGRPGTPMLTLCIAAALMSAQDPRVLNDVGFQLSFGATAGLMLLATPLRAAGERLASALPPLVQGGVLFTLEGFSTTLAATAGALPVMLHAFGRLSLVSPLANAAAVPLFPLVILTSSFAALLAALFPPLAPIVGAVAWVPLAVTITIAHAAAHLPAASVALPQPDGYAIATLYIAVLAVSLAARRSTPPFDDEAAPVPWRMRPLWVGVALLPVTAAVLGVIALTAPATDGRLSVIFAMAGGSPITLVAGPGGERILVDVGPSATALARALDPLLPSSRRSVAAIVLTRPWVGDADALTETAERYRVRTVLAPLPVETPDAVRVPLVRAAPGGELLLSHGVRLAFVPIGGETERVGVVAVMGRTRIGITPGTVADVELVRRDRDEGGGLTVTLSADRSTTFSLSSGTVVRVSTDGTTVRIQRSGSDRQPTALVSSALTPEAR